MPKLTMAYLLLNSIFFLSANSFAQKEEKTLDVIVQTVTQRNLENDIETLGSIRAIDSTPLTSKVSKTITAIYFEDGQYVKKNSVLVTMADAEETALMHEAQITMDEAKKQLDRVQALAKSSAISPSLLDQSTREYAVAKAHYVALQSRVQDLQIIAPFSGSIGIRDISIGSLVAPGQVIATINDDSQMKLDFTVPSVNLPDLHKDLKIEARSLDLNNQTFAGKISSIDNQIDETTRSIKVRAMLENKQHQLTQGMLMKVLIKTNARKSFVISEAALVPMGSNNFVFVLQKNETASGSKWVAKKQQIQIGKREAGIVEIVSGINANDKVVTHGLQQIHDGQFVTILAEQSNNPNKPVETLTELLKQKKQ